MQKKRLLIASLLKPVDDPRMYEKLGLSLNKINGFEVNIAGFQGKIPTETDIVFHPLFSFDRMNIWMRAKAQSNFNKFLKKLQPDIIIVETHELLQVCVKYKKKKECRIIYDVRENYELNVLNTSAFPSPIRNQMAQLVRSNERNSLPFIDDFIIAEEVYREQLDFLPKDSLLLPNALKQLTQQTNLRDPYQLLFTGTIARQSGIEEAVQLTSHLHTKDSRYHLKVVGNCFDKGLWKTLQEKCKGLDYIHLPESSELTPHSEILNSILSAGFGFIHYKALPHLRGKTPTKYFEYAGSGLPILLFNSHHLTLPEPPSNLITLDSLTPDNLPQTSTNTEITPSHLWDFYEQKLLRLV